MRNAEDDERPLQISTAVTLIWISICLGTLDSILLWRNLTASASVGFVVSVQVFTVALLACLTYKIWCGRNWARIVFVVLWAIGLIPYASTLPKFFTHSTIAGGINLFQTLLQLSALGLIFIGPGRFWFMPRPTA